MLFVIGEQNSLANHFLLELRDKEKQLDRARFRQNLEKLGEIMAYEISKQLTYRSQEVTGMLGNSSLYVLKDQPVLITILRAGLPYFNGFQNFFDQAESGFIGAYRTESEHDVTIRLEYSAMPPLQGKVVILIDPMLATGRSVVDAVKNLSAKSKPDKIIFASLVCSPEGIEHLRHNISVPYDVFTFAVDERLDDRFYIVPGLGDAGDLSFGEKIM